MSRHYAREQAATRKRETAIRGQATKPLAPEPPAPARSRAVRITAAPIPEPEQASKPANSLNNSELRQFSGRTSMRERLRATLASCPINRQFLSSHAKSVCVRVVLRPLQAISRAFKAIVRPEAYRPSLRLSVLAGAAFLGILVCAMMVAGEIDLNRLMPGATSADGRPVIVVQNGRLMNTGAGPALNLEVTRPRYRLVGTLPAGQGIEIPASDFAVQFEWNEGNQTKRATRSFKVGDASAAGNGRVAGTTQGVATVALSGAPTADLAPPGIAATYDPATHLLTIAAQRPIEVRVDGFLLRPVSRTEKEGAEYRYVQANVLVLGQDIRQGDTVQFEVVFTKPQDFYSIPIYVRELGKPFVYFTVSVALQPEQPAA